MGHAKTPVAQVFYTLNILIIPILLLSLCNTIHLFYELFSVREELIAKMYIVLSRAVARAFPSTGSCITFTPKYYYYS
jgi:hypothetical protein